jgi:hypothetical protein
MFATREALLFRRSDEHSVFEQTAGGIVKKTGNPDDVVGHLNLL